MVFSWPWLAHVLRGVGRFGDNRHGTPEKEIAKAADSDATRPGGIEKIAAQSHTQATIRASHFFLLLKLEGLRML